MANKPTIKQTIVREYLKKFPNSNYTSLARKIYKENELIFKDVETIRTHIRKVVGSAGTIRNAQTKDKSMFQANRKSVYELPESYANDYTPYEIKQSRILIISDLHFPYQNNEAITLALDYGKSKKIDCLHSKARCRSIYA